MTGFCGSDCYCIKLTNLRVSGRGQQLKTQPPPPTHPISEVNPYRTNVENRVSS